MGTRLIVIAVWVGVICGALLAVGPVHGADTPTPKPAKAKAAGAKTKIVQPTGFGPAKFGMSVAEVWKMYPKATFVGEEEQLGAPVVEGPYVDRLVLRDVPVPGFPKPTMVELRFWNDHLWGVIIYFGENDPAASQAYLIKRFGSNFGPNPTNPVWKGETVTTTGAVKQKWYGTVDNKLSDQARKWFTDMFNGLWTAETPDEKAAREKRIASWTPQAVGTPQAAGTPTPAGPPATAPAAAPPAK